MTVKMTLIMTLTTAMGAITGTTRRLRGSDEELVRILTQSFELGANIAAVARRHGVAS